MDISLYEQDFYTWTKFQGQASCKIAQPKPCNEIFVGNAEYVLKSGTFVLYTKWLVTGTLNVVVQLRPRYFKINI